MRSLGAAILSVAVLSALLPVWSQSSHVQAAAQEAGLPSQNKTIGANPGDAMPGSPEKVFGFRDFSQQWKWDRQFLAVPDRRLAEEHLRTLTAEPHIAASPEDKKTADYVAQKFREAGLETTMVEYRVWMNYPQEIGVKITAPAGIDMSGPTREHVDDDPYQDDPRVVMPFSGSSPSGDAEADVVYANYGRPEDFRKLDELKIDVKGKIVVVRYGTNFRGVKSYLAQERGAAAVILYSDPMDDGYFKGDTYPKGPYRPDTGVQRGSIQLMFQYPGDPTTPGFASVPSLPDSQRVPPDKSASMPKIPTTPLSYHDITPVLANLGGPACPREWQGALPFTYHIGPGPVKVRVHLKQDYAYRTIWNVIGKIPGAEFPAQWVVAGNHRDAWVYGAVDPGSGTAAMLETVHGLGELLKAGYKPRRTIVMASWDAEEQGLIGSTEWAEDHETELRNAAAYFNTDIGVSGPNFAASAEPALKRFLREATREVPSPAGGTVYDVWRKSRPSISGATADVSATAGRHSKTTVDTEVEIGDLGSGSDYSVFLQHLGIPSTDIGSNGPYGVYHSVFDNFAWFKKFGDPDFKYEQQMARIFGLEILHMADADVLPYDFELYGKEIRRYIGNAKRRAEDDLGGAHLNFSTAMKAADRFATAGSAIAGAQIAARNAAALNPILLQAERALLLEHGLPNRPWFRHAIYAPGEYTGYAAVVLPGVNEAIDARDGNRAREQLEEVARALNRSAKIMESFSAIR